MKMKEETYRLIMMVGLYLGMILFIIAIILLAKNIEEIRNDPILYGMDKHEFNSCTCFNNDFEYTTITLDDYKQKEVDG